MFKRIILALTVVSVVLATAGFDSSVVLALCALSFFVGD